MSDETKNSYQQNLPSGKRGRTNKEHGQKAQETRVGTDTISEAYTMKYR